MWEPLGTAAWLCYCHWAAAPNNRKKVAEFETFCKIGIKTFEFIYSFSFYSLHPFLDQLHSIWDTATTNENCTVCNLNARYKKIRLHFHNVLSVTHRSVRLPFRSEVERSAFILECSRASLSEVESCNISQSALLLCDAVLVCTDWTQYSAN